jgi:hypothetical protein
VPAPLAEVAADDGACRASPEREGEHDGDGAAHPSIMRRFAGGCSPPRGTVRQADQVGAWARTVQQAAVKRTWSPSMKGAKAASTAATTAVRVAASTSGRATPSGPSRVT